MRTRDEGAGEGKFRHPVEAELDTAEEQARALLVELRNSFAPTYLTLISILQGVLLGLLFELLSDRWQEFRASAVAPVLVFNNVVLIALVWNEYRMGSYMFRWVPHLLDAVIPFAVGGFQAALMLAVGHPIAWLAWLATFYLAGIVAFENMYRRSTEEQRNAFVLDHNQPFRRLNVLASLGISALLWIICAAHVLRGTSPGWPTWLLVTSLNVAFLVRGEINWRHIVAAARRATAGGPAA